MNFERRASVAGFSEFEFLGLVAAGLLIAGLLAHFFIDQSVQVEKLKALVSRDAVRLNLETRLLDREVILKSVSALPDTSDNANIRACVLGASRETCQSRARRSLPILDLGDEKKIVGGTTENPSCLDQNGKAVERGANPNTCFATARVSIEVVCPDGRTRCRRAQALFIRYQIQFKPELIKNEPDLNSLERTLSLVL